MKCAIKRTIDENIEADRNRAIIKQFLYTLYVSEGFGEKRLLRVLLKWADTYAWVNDPKNDKNDVLLKIDSILDSVMPPSMVKAIGYEPLKDKYGRVIK